MINPYIFDDPSFVDEIEKAIEEDGTSLICTFVASAIKMLEANAKIYGFASGDNPDAVYFFDEDFPNSDEGHHFAVLNDRYIIDPWIYNNFTDNYPNTFNRSVFDIESAEDEKMIKYLYGKRENWVDITDNVELFQGLLPETSKRLLDFYKNMF